METNDNATDNLSVQASVSYTDPGGIVQSDSGNQSVHTHGTQGTVHTAPNSGNSNAGASISSSPHRGGTTTTPLSISPSSTTGHSQVHPDVLGTVEPMPQYVYRYQQQQQQLQQTPVSIPHQAQHPQHGEVFTGVSQRNVAMAMRHQQLRQTYPASRERSNPVSEDDDLTEPSTSNNTRADTSGSGTGYNRADGTGATSTFGKLIQSASKVRSVGGSLVCLLSALPLTILRFFLLQNANNRNLNYGRSNRKTMDEDAVVVEGALIYGYLQKLGRNGKWQARWFESDGECLTYYKSNKRIKLLATLDLAKVGSIVINDEDEKECCFIINISERPYHLRADSPAACKDWVITLNRVKEARMHEGNVKLLLPNEINQPPDLLDLSFTPRVVVIANRQRTHAVEDDDIASWEALGGRNENTNPNKFDATPPASARLARWQKPKTSIARFASKLLAWARNIRRHGCQDAENHVVLDHHLHPPGHDDKVRQGAPGHGAYSINAHVTHGQTRSNASVETNQSPSTWIQNQNSTEKSFPREVVRNDFLDPDSMNNQAQSSSTDVTKDDEDEARYLS